MVVSRTQTARRRSRRAALALACALAAACCALAATGAAPPAPALPSDPAALLRDARARLRDGELDAAVALLERAAREHPVIGDHATALRARALLAAGDRPGGVAALLEAIERFPASRLRPDLYRELGDARLAFGDEGGARSAWQAALAGTRDGAMRASLQAAVAGSYERVGEAAKAYEAYRELWSRYPTSAQAREASARLDALEAAGVAAPRTANDWRRRGDELFRRHHNAGALESYDRALALGLKKASERSVRMQRAHTLFRMRRYPEAVEAFAALPRTAESRLWHARSLARADRVPESIEAFETLAREGNGAIGIRSMYLAGLLLDGRDFHERARAHFERVAASREYADLAQGALWRLAWREYRDGDCAAALPRLGRLVEIEKDAVVALQYRYWRARCLEKLGRPEAQTEFAAMADAFPFTYYGWRASFRVASPPAATPTRTARKLADGALSLGFAQTLRARILLGAGYDDLARDELRVLSGRVRSLADRLELARLMSDAGDYNGAQLLIVSRHVGLLAGGPVPRREDLWWHAWPAAFPDEVDRAVARPGAADRELVYAIMREESSYRPTVLSPSGAYGLMQIMPATGAKLARDVGRTPFATDDLLVPEVNVELGARYLGQLSARFPERLSAAIASYNAGPGAVSEWIARDPAAPDDEWVEAIPYDETRGYVKRVLRSLHAYRVLY
ncbi:MAG: transglycosylase SLT domain-containing protein [Myxococcota bacterium]